MKYVHAPGSHAPLAVWVRALGVVEVSDVRKVRDNNKYRIEKVSATPPSKLLALRNGGCQQSGGGEPPRRGV